MTTHYQEVHNLKQEIRRMRLQMIEQKSDYDNLVRALKREIVQPKTDINLEPTPWREVLRAICEVYDLTPDTVITRSRKRRPLYARHMFNHI